MLRGEQRTYQTSDPSGKYYYVGFLGQKCIYVERERQTDRQRERDRQTDRQRKTNRERETDKQTDRDLSQSLLQRLSQSNDLTILLLFYLGVPDMDLARRAMLKPFGLVQHAVLESPDLNTVHVIYGHTNKAFAHNGLIKELVTRTGLQLVWPQSRVATSSSEGDGVVLVIVDRHDSPFTDRLLREAVETAGHPDTRTLFLQKERYCPD